MFETGHREARAYKPDVRRTRDDEIGVVHNVEVDRPTNGKGLVHELTLNYIKQLEVI